MSIVNIPHSRPIHTSRSRKPKRKPGRRSEADNAESRLARIYREITSLEAMASQMRATLEFQASMIASAHGIDFCIAPPPSIIPTGTGQGLPDRPGVYFVWQGASVAYIGKSRRLKLRVTLSHSSIRSGDLISFLEFDEIMIDFKELMYIGLYVPPRNFNMKLALSRM
jgi:hypothetical protein